MCVAADSSSRGSPARDSPVRDSPVHDLPVYHESPVRDSPVHESPVRYSPVSDSPVHESPVYDSPVYRDSPDDDVRHESDPSSLGNGSSGSDSNGVLEIGFQGDIEDDVVTRQGDIGAAVQGQSNVQEEVTSAEIEESEPEGDIDKPQGDSEGQTQHGSSDLDLVTSQPVTMTSQSVEESEEALNDGTVVRTRVTTTTKVLC